uniref:G-protein coupled receptors family 1 profile domain-containing protein n=1 Tax=Plectus sambesii TaxID=2011161 RepID=A0A914XS44_9BILA
MSVVVDESFFSTASVVLFAPTAPSSYSAAAPTSSTQNDTAAMHVAFDDGHSSTDSTDSTKLWALILIFIPIVTILGNLLVIISVLRFKTLHSAINFLILGLAVADLMVALFVMPYAVYVEVSKKFALFHEIGSGTFTYQL